MSGNGPQNARPWLSFGVNVGWMHGGAGANPIDAAREAEAAGFDIVTAADHVGRTSPIVALSAAAAVTTRVRLRTYVLDYGFWNPGLLARDIATLDAVSGGRVELGLGMGHMAREHTTVGLPFPPYAERLPAFSGFVEQVRRHLDRAELDPQPVQDRIPVVIGSMSRRGLELAAREADVIALTGLLHVPGQPGGTFSMSSAAQTDEQVGRVRDLQRRYGLAIAPFDVLLQQVVIDRDPGEAAEAFAATTRGGITAAELLDSPFVLYAAGAQEAADELVRRSARWGIGSWCVHAPSGAALAQVIEVLRR